MKNKENIALVSKEFIEDKIYIIRGQKVMLDADLAKIYGYTTSMFNRQVQRNIDKFDSDFMFQLNKIEYEILIYQSGTSSWGGVRKLPFAFSVDLSNESRQFI